MTKLKVVTMTMMLTALGACGGHSGDKTRATSTAVEANTPDDSTGNLPAEAQSFSVNLKLLGMSDAQAAKLGEAAEIIKRVVATDEFRQLVLNHARDGVRTYVNNRGMTNEQVYRVILDASERLRPAKDNTMDLEVVLYSAATLISSYTFTDVLKVWLNSKYFNRDDGPELAGRLMHEWLHKTGFDHKKTTARSKKFSVPYAVARMVTEIGQGL